MIIIIIIIFVLINSRIIEFIRYYLSQLFLKSDSELLVDSYSEGEEEPTSLLKRLSNDSLAESEIRLLIERKEELERRQRKQERHRQRVQVGHFVLKL